MTEPEEHFCRIEIEGGGQYVNRIKSYSLSSDYTVPTDGWSIELYDHEDARDMRRLFLPLTPVRILIDNALQVVGRIDVTEGVENSGLRLQGRDFIADLADASVDPTLKFKKSEGLADVILRIFEPYGVTGVAHDGLAGWRNILTGKSVTDKVSIPPKRSFQDAKLDEFKAGYNMGAFQLAANIAARHGFTIQPTGKRYTVALAEPEYDSEPVYSLERGEFGNVMRASARRDWSKVPTIAIAHGKATGSGRKNSHGSKREALAKLGTTAEERRILEGSKALPDRHKSGDGAAPGFYRPMFVQDTKAQNQEQLERYLRRAVSERRHQTLTYRCTLQGHKDRKTGAYYSVDTIAKVYDPIEDVDENLWVKSRTFRNDGRSGPTTDLELIRPYTWVVS